MRKLIKKYPIIILIFASLIFLASIFGDHNHNKLIFLKKLLTKLLTKLTVSLYDFIWTIPFAIVALYLIVSCIICCIFVFKPNYITPKLIAEHEIWFLISFLTYMRYSIYTISFHINKLLTSNPHIDILFENKFFLVKRKAYQNFVAEKHNFLHRIPFFTNKPAVFVEWSTQFFFVSKDGKTCLYFFL